MTEVWHLNSRFDDMLAFGPDQVLVEYPMLFSSQGVGLRAAAAEGVLHDDALRPPHALGRRFVPAEQQIDLVDELRRNDRAVVKARQVFAEFIIRGDFRQVESADALILDGAVLIRVEG